jgi:hypothetical protein
MVMRSMQRYKSPESSVAMAGENPTHATLQTTQELCSNGEMQRDARYAANRSKAL